MNAEFEELYQQVILDHSKRPRNYGKLNQPTVAVDGDNPSCGDEIHLELETDPEGQIKDLKFTGQGCAISQASASLMTLKLKGKSRAEAESLLHAFTDVVTTGANEPPAALGDLQLFAGVRKFPQRVKCAMLAWRALDQALRTAPSANNTVSTGASETGVHCAI
jgi:nitrogen fixation NifU-like protein